ncbi:MAG: hypothetical protein ACRDS0_07565, partial [Pseudonocardiaceae bacterium]
RLIQAVSRLSRHIHRHNSHRCLFRLRSYTVEITVPASNVGSVEFTARGIDARPATDLNGRTGTQTIEEGAEIIVRMAQVGPDGPTGGYFDVTGPLRC